MPWISSPTCICRCLTVPFGSTGDNSGYVTDKVSGKLLGFIFHYEFHMCFLESNEIKIPHIQLCCALIGMLLVFVTGLKRLEAV